MEETGIKRISLILADLKEHLLAMQELDMDFDDAYQYVAAKNNHLILVSFDRDLDETDLQRKTPAMVLAEIADCN